jgi:tetratricopeptide (TPR) repeat protein
MHFPFSWGKVSLQPEDLDRFAPFFRRTVRQFFSCQAVRLEPAGAWDETASGAGQPAMDPTGPSLALPLWEGEHFLGLAVASGGDPALYRNRSPEWLRERGDLVCREMRLLKQWSTDSVTGLPDGRLLLDGLQLLLTEAAACQGPDQHAPVAHLMLIEIYPRASNAEQGLLGIARIGSQIEELIGGGAALHHLGAGIFARICLNVPEDQLLKIGNGVLRWLKRENMARGHIGITAVPGQSVAATPEQAAKRMIEQAWQALGVARRRAPRALCTYEVLTSRKEHPFAEIPAAVVTELKRLWRGVAQFALILLHQDQEPAAAHFPIASPAPDGSEYGVLPLSARQAFVLLPGAGPQEVKRWITDFKERLPAAGLGSCSMGIALFPCLGFKKKDMVLNARKALLHTRFFGPDSATFFDSVSLNISGDVYYEEGDLARAIKEYRRGLALAADSVNLLNSLGVAYAQMNRYRKAVPLFEKVLGLDPENFMALFNLGYAHLAFADTAGALNYFTRALAQEENNFDLLLQLGKLHCQAGNFGQAVGILVRAEQFEPEERNKGSRGRVYFYLGQACKEVGQLRQAMVHLQRALQCNPHDAGAISLLGELYALEDQGEEIALSFCCQAVEIDDTRSEHWRRLGLVHWRRGEKEEAVAAVRQSLRLDRRNTAALRLLGGIFRRQGRFSQARLIYQRLLKLHPDDPEAGEALRALGKAAAGSAGSSEAVKGGKLTFPGNTDASNARVQPF